jgi:selenide,water dikinase
MDQSNAKAAKIIRAHGTAGCTDVTGFGLLGHLGEMLRAATLGARLDVSAIPHLQGALELLDAGESSSLQDNNEQIFSDCRFEGCSPTAAEVRVLADPQTAGGLLAGVDAARANACLRELLSAGYSAAAIGKIDLRDEHDHRDGAYIKLLG